jgi:triosephosphate isomerase
MRVPIIAGNWKMNTTVAEALALVREMRPELEAIAGVESVVCPPFVSLAPVADLLSGSSLAVGAQNVFWEEKGAYTGEISPVMLAPLCQYVIIGHSERRKYFHETDEIVNRKAKAALQHGLKTIICVGEDLDQNEAGRTAEVVSRQIQEGLRDLPGLANVVVAYEPIWAIGTGRPATGSGANGVIGLIRDVLAGMFGRPAADAVRIQYGGSVTAANIAEFMGQPEVDGALVGGASLKAAEFVAIVQATRVAKAPR